MLTWHSQKLQKAGTQIGRPERVIPLIFLLGIAIGTFFLALPMSRAGGMGGEGADFITALFTATSAFCVTGLTLVDTPTYWSPFGHVIIMLLTEAGGLGIMTGATLIGLMVTRKIRLRGQLLASAEMRSLDLGDVRHVLRLVLSATLITQGVIAVMVALRLWSLGRSFLESLWHGLFHAVSAFMNAGFSTLPEGLPTHSGDWFLALPLMAGVVLGGIGFPVLYELRKEWRNSRSWTIHTKLTLWGYLVFTFLGMGIFLLLEYRNPATLGALPWDEQVLGSLFHSVMTRSGGFDQFDVGAMERDSLLISIAMMFIGGGSASTAGGIRITTFLLLGFVVWSEIRGHPDSTAFRRRISPEAIRQAVAVVLTSLATVSIGILVLASFVEAPLEYILFEAVSAFATVGLSTGLAPTMPAGGQLVLIVLMYVGRVGSVSLVAAIAQRMRSMPYRYPEEKPLVG